jgi:serine/threonine protein kinase
VALEPHARGGLGEVFSATDTELHRRVALKRLQDRRASDAASQRRFLVEAEVTARLEHPGVVPVYSLYRDEDQRPCYTMRFIEGQTLAEALREYHAGPPDQVAFRRLLQSFIQVCETVAYAHSRGVIHRDLKPLNIMLGKFGETLIVDWGLAKIVGRSGEEPSDQPETTLRLMNDSDSDRTQMGSAVGTPAYMSPQRSGSGNLDCLPSARGRG